MGEAIKIIQRNRHALFGYELFDKLEAGLVLKGSEVKSLRDGKVSLAEAYARPRGDEIWLYNMDISPYPQAGPLNHEPKRPRKLLLKRREIDRLSARLKQRGLTLVPLALYFKDGYAKIEVALARGRRKFEKRDVIRKREADREIRKRMMK